MGAMFHCGIITGAAQECSRSYHCNNMCLAYTSIKNHFYKMKRDIGMADYEKQVKQEFHTPSLYLCFVIGA